jgi:predicted amidohydrolase
MIISIVQPDIAWEDKSSNFKRIERLISQISNKTDIVILPEMFSTGFSMNQEKLSESPGKETFRWMAGIASVGNFGICGSYIVRYKNQVFNRWVFVSPERRSWHYDKRHLFRMGDEETAFTRGDKRVIIRFRKTRICPNVCYDLRFPVWSRNRNDYDLLINSANWPEARRDVWITLLKARAIENQCFVAGANRTGVDGKGVRYCGDSMIINPRGEIISSANDTETVLTAEISTTDLFKQRKKFPVHLDADEFTFTS